MGGFSRVYEALRGVVLRRRADAETDEELRFHLDMEAERLVRQEGFSPAEARRRAALVFGSVDRHREEVRDARGLAWLTGMSLDFRLGGRMLVRSWGLTLVAVLGMALAMALGAVFHAASRLVDAPLPLDAGAEIVAIEYWDTEANNQERRILHDVAIWRRELRSIRDVAAYRTTGHNLLTADGVPELVAVAEMTASGFRVARVGAFLGRTLVDEDELQDAAPVVVLGHDIWRSRFGADPEVIGRTVHLGADAHTVVGVMPEGFAFPLNHRMWTPLRAEATAPRAGPGIRVFGRLAPRTTLSRAQAELAALGERAAAASPGTHARLRATVMPYPAQLFDDMQGWEIPFIHTILILLLLLVCANIAILVYARTVARTGEIAVRSALGASRRRILGQLYVEALVLAAAAAVVGLLVASAAVAHINTLLSGWGGPDGAGGLPFWIRLRLTPATVLFVLFLAALSALVIGVLPARRVAGGRVQRTLRELSGGSGLQLGRTWSVLIIAQVAITVALLPPAASAAWKSMLHATADPGFAASDYFGGTFVLPRNTDEADAAYRQRYGEQRREFVQRATAAADARAVTWAVDLPGHEPTVRVEVSGASAGDGRVMLPVRFGRVDPGYFAVFGVAPIAGRALHASDALRDVRTVVVNRSFAAMIPSGAAVGTRLRYVAGYRSGGVVRVPAGVTMEEWYEIVGVVPDFPEPIDPDEVTARVYHAAADDDPDASVFIVNAPDARAGVLAPQLRSTAAGINATLQLRDVRSLDTALREMQAGLRLIAVVLGTLMLSVLLLSGAGISALMAFTVARRRREIGIRAALGADPRQLLLGIFARACRQLAAGAGTGLAVAALLDIAAGGALMDGRALVLLPAIATMMMLTGIIATLNPARRGLRIEPTEALRSD